MFLLVDNVDNSVNWSIFVYIVHIQPMVTPFPIWVMHGYVEFISCIYYNTSTLYYINRPIRYHITVMSLAHHDVAPINLDDVIVMQVFYYIFIIFIPLISSFVVVYCLHEKML